ncbi:hypothetical protein NDU88_009990 [Pleurodeles waltl]|uniref:Uncharacterized protein n=1 Tax=Pleurodeles waltl TaxID=8319 RepID=A0AAV7RZ83_PLEWA|nr:hypothetical protein NDU88_009990 [Pleurodeles waltl]
MGNLQPTTPRWRLGIPSQHHRVLLTLGNLQRQPSLPSEHSGTGRVRLSTPRAPVSPHSAWYSLPHPLLLRSCFAVCSSGFSLVSSPEGARGSSPSLVPRHRVSAAPSVSRECSGERGGPAAATEQSSFSRQSGSAPEGSLGTAPPGARRRSHGSTPAVIQSTGLPCPVVLGNQGLNPHPTSRAGPPWCHAPVGEKPRAGRGPASPDGAAPHSSRVSTEVRGPQCMRSSESGTASTGSTSAVAPPAHAHSSGKRPPGALWCPATAAAAHHRVVPRLRAATQPGPPAQTASGSLCGVPGNTFARPTPGTRW